VAKEAADETPGRQPPTEITNVRQIRLLAAQTPKTACSIRLEGDVWWVNPTQGMLVLKDDSGAEEIEMDWRGAPAAAGQRVRLEGIGTITPAGAGFRLGAKGPVVDNDGVHGMVEKSGAVFLKAGRNPLRVEWFNGIADYGLRVEYEGPSLPRTKIPDAALFRMRANEPGGATNWVNGLDFRCVETPPESQSLPDFDALAAIKTGTVENFDLRVMSRPEHVGLRFTGFLDVPQDGLYTFHTISDDGSRLFVGEPSLHLQVIGPAEFPKPRSLAIGQTLGQGESGQWVEVEGKVTFVSEKPDVLVLELSAGTGRMRVEVAEAANLSPALLVNRRVRVTGFCLGAAAGDGHGVPSDLLVPSGHEVTLLDPPTVAVENMGTNEGELPLLSSAAEVHRLKREEAQRRYPVKIQGVITSVLPEHQAFTIQDSTRGIYVVDQSESRSDPPRIGELLQVEGFTDPSLFAPVINARRVRLLGAGDLPEPVHPTRDQLMNGSLDAQYVEIQGIITSVLDDEVVLLTSDGRIKSEIRVPGLKPREIARYEDAVIRVRGCLFATWNYVTRRVKVDEIRIYGADIMVDQPAPADLFSTPKKRASEIFQFDPQASVFQRVRVSGQIIHVRDSEYFMMDGNSGVRFVSKHPGGLEIGDWVEVVGFPELSLATPVLREATARKIGHAALPKARALLGPDDLIRADLDSTRVRVTAVMVDQRNTPTEQVLEMRLGLRPFLARFTGADAGVHAIPVGSQLELTGTYASQGASQGVASFELLLDSAADLAVLARPPWWTLERLAIILGALACILAFTVLWITQLRQKVERRTAELEVQIRERQRVEQQHTIEQERARIAQDLHDDLGSGLTEITMLAARARTASVPLAPTGGYLDQMGGKARQMVMALDEIVWAMNPTHDSLASMVSYFSLHAERFLGLANIAWRLERPFRPDDHAVDSQHRHQLFLAFKEALTNIVRHSGAAEVSMNIQIEQERLRLTIADNGRGWGQTGLTEEMDGIANMRARLEKLGGRFEVTSKTGEGTVVRFDMPLR
jgi:signal transduction histidine kinase